MLATSEVGRVCRDTLNSEGLDPSRALMVASGKTVRLLISMVTESSSR